MPVWVYEVVEVYDKHQRPLGKFRCVRWPDDQPTHVEGLCTHTHDNSTEALACSVVTGILEVEFRERVSAEPGPRAS